MRLEQLDHPVWHSLWDIQDKQAVLFPYILAYHPDYAIFADSYESHKVANSLEIYAQLTPRFYFVGDVPALPSSLKITDVSHCSQMVWNHSDGFKDIPAYVEELDESNTDEIVEVIKSVQPEFVQSKTPLLGKYFGVRVDGQLVSVAGQRMHLVEFIEVSGCVTRPEHRKKGYQSAVIKAVINNILSKGKTPFLHVNENNRNAISVYQSLGFETRRRLSFWEIQ